MAFVFERLAIPEVVLIKPDRFRDERGFFIETYKSRLFKENGVAGDFVQDNHSCSRRGVLRGLHYQKTPHAQGKLVRVVRGSIFDVAVDIRRGSPSYGRWVSAVLSTSNHHMLWVPPGFAHGALALEDDTHLLYKVTDYYDRECERGIRWDDAALGIAWPIAQPELAEKDRAAPLLAHADHSFSWSAAGVPS